MPNALAASCPACKAPAGYPCWKLARQGAPLGKRDAKRPASRTTATHSARTRKATRLAAVLVGPLGPLVDGITDDAPGGWGRS